MTARFDAPARPSPVEATLNYLVPMREKPRTLAYEPPPGVLQTNATYETREVLVHDLRAAGHGTSLDEEGFTLVQHRSAIGNFYDEDELRRVYYLEAERLIAILTGGIQVMIFDHTIRRRVPGVNDRAEGTPRQPVSSVHNDYTQSSGPQRLQDLQTRDNGLGSPRRFSIVNLWRPIHGPLYDMPLAVCNARSVTRADLIAADLVYPDRTGENYLVTYSAAHQWYYAPGMRMDEALLFRCYDSATDGRARFTPHAAFTDPIAPANAPPRESIELRAVVLYAM